jgi:hypothetical protein
MDLAITHTTTIAQLTKMAFSAVAVTEAGPGKQLFLLFLIFIQA